MRGHSTLFYFVMTKYDADARFERFITERPPNGCWLWAGYLNKNGYGFFWTGTRKTSAHRAAYERVHGPLSAEMHVHHECGIRCCVNPAHLRAVPVAENLALRGRVAPVQPRVVSRQTDPRVRFYSFVQRTESCWLWTGSSWKGYGQFTDGRRVKAHRFAYELERGPIPEGYQIDHLCKNTLCVNPDHLEPVTQYENNMRSNSPAARHARKTHCPRGHDYTETAVLNSRGSRECRICRRDYSREYCRRARGTRPENHRRLRA